MRRAATWTITLLITFAVALSFSGSVTAQGDDNRGTIKIHDDLDADPDVRDEPHVSCDFWVQAFNMKDPQGFLVFEAWPPTSNKAEITPGGDDLNWTGTPDGDGEWNFTKGAYTLPAGHYRVEAFTTDGHPGHEHFAEAKMFWVDPCDGTQPVCVDDPGTSINDCDPQPCVDDPETEIDECDETEIPFFPGFTALVLGSLGTLAAVGYIVRRRS